METQTIEEKQIVLDSTLEKIELQTVDVEKFNTSLLRQKTDIIIRDCIGGEVRHNNYLEYIARCWKNHYGAIVSPDFLWQIVLAEFATFIKDNASTYKHLFTAATSDKKTEIKIPTNDEQLIDINKIMDELKKLVPTDTDLFVPSFTTTSFPAHLAFCATFADAMSPFYNYSMFCCGIPKVKVLGAASDWAKFSANIYKIDHLFKNSTVSQYCTKISTLISNIIAKIDDAEFWQGMFRLDRCGSGGQVEVKGWFADLYMKTPRPAYINNYPTSVAYVPYTNLSNGKKYELIYGLFSSEVEDDYLVPEFSYLISEVA